MGKSKSLAWSPVRNIMKSVGASVVEREAVNFLIDHLTNVATNLTAKALKFTRHGKRSKLTKGDLELAAKI